MFLSLPLFFCFLFLKEWWIIYLADDTVEKAYEKQRKRRRNEEDNAEETAETKNVPKKQKLTAKQERKVSKSRY